MVEANDVLSLILGGLLVSGVVWMITMMIRVGRKTDEMWEAHLGPAALDPETGQPRWYEQRSAMADLAKAFKEEGAANRSVISKNTEVMQAVLTEIKIDRRVAQRLQEAAGNNHGEQS